MRKVYLAGPMSGIRNFNYPAFKAAAKDLRGRGIEVVCPTETDALHGWAPGEHDPDQLDGAVYRQCLRHALRAALADDVEGCVVLPGWEASTGARTEVAVIRALRLPVVAYPDLGTVA
jgi:hypothetical protein